MLNADARIAEYNYCYFIMQPFIVLCPPSVRQSIRRV